MPSPEPKAVAGLTGATAKPLERIPVRARALSVTVSAWRLEVASDQGSGTIVRAESSPEEAHYRGEGLFLGWPQQQLAEVYEAFLPEADDGGLETCQLG